MSLVIGSARIRGGEPQDVIVEARAIVAIEARGAFPAAPGATALHDAFGTSPAAGARPPRAAPSRKRGGPRA
jgi:hypothetical protein